VSFNAWPDIIGQQSNRSAPIYVTLQSDPTTAGDQRRNLAPFHYEYTLGWSFLNAANAGAIHDAVIELGGPWGTTSWFEWDVSDRTGSGVSAWFGGFNVGPGDGATKTFTLPAKQTSSQVIYVAGTPTAVTISAGAGPLGEDQITFASAPALHATISAFLVGRIRQSVRINQTSVTFTDTPAGLWQTNLAFICENPI
jgi:hypothetical protein